MSNKPVEAQKITFDEALRRIASFDKEKLSCKLKRSTSENHTKIVSKAHKNIKNKR